MAKWNKSTIGTVVQGKVDPTTGVKKPSYIQLSQDVVLKKGSYLNLENEKIQLSGIKDALANNKMSKEVADAAIERTEKYWNEVIETKSGAVKRKDMVLFNIVRIEKQD